MRSSTAVHFFLEDGFMVRGVDDPCEAYRLALEEDEGRIGYWANEACQPEDEVGVAWPDKPNDIAELADEVWEAINTAHVQRCRIVPTGPDHPDGYAWMVWQLEPGAKGPGIFTAVMFS